MTPPAIFILLIVLLFCPPVQAEERLHHEKEYQNKWCIDHGGKIEFGVPGKVEIDCMTDQFAIEVEFADHWDRALGRARYFSVVTGREPGVLLIVENVEKDFKYLVRLLTAINDDNKSWRVWVIKPENL